jgi:molybdopterin molybdotransferase
MPKRVALAAPVECPRAATYFVPVSVAEDEQGLSWATPRPPNGSGDFLSLAGTDGFVELPPGPNTYTAGFLANLHRW